MQASNVVQEGEGERCGDLMQFALNLVKKDHCTALRAVQHRSMTLVALNSVIASKEATLYKKVKVRGVGTRCSLV